MPDDVRLVHLSETHHDTFKYLLSGKAKVNKNHNILVNRAIWFNELDPKHTFNTRFSNARANCVIVSQHEKNDTIEDGVPQLQCQYFVACREYRDSRFQDETEAVDFGEREAFIQSWQDSREDIIMFTRGEIDRFSGLASSLLAALPSLPPTASTTVVDAASDKHRGKGAQAVVAVEGGGDDVPLATAADDITMEDLGDMHPAGTSYNDYVNKASNEKERDRRHTYWTWYKIGAIQEKIEELLATEPRDETKVLQFYAEMVQMDKEEEMRLLLKKMDV